MFNFEKETKEKYFQKAEEILKAHELECFQIDRSRITVVKNEKLKIYVVPFTKKNVTNTELAAVKAIPGFHIVNDRYTRHKPGREKPATENGYFEFMLEEEDR